MLCETFFSLSVVASPSTLPPRTSPSSLPPPSHLPRMASRSQGFLSAASETASDSSFCPPLPMAQPTSAPQASPREPPQSLPAQPSTVLSVIQLGSSQVQWTTVVPVSAQPLHAGASLRSKKAHRSVNAPWKLFDHECPSRHATSPSPSPASPSSKSKSKSLIGSKILAHSAPLSASPAARHSLDGSPLAPVTLR